jgi:hypothetical protein
MDDVPADALLSIGEVAAIFGVAPETVRSWGRRYGLVASGRTAGGHRRYNRLDVTRLAAMQERVARGFGSAEAARRALLPRITEAEPVPPPSDVASPGRGRRKSGAGGRVLAVPGGSPEARGLARAASRLDAATATSLIGELLIADGAVAVWNQLLVPVLRAAGRQWEKAGEGVEIEHVLTEAIIESARAYAAFLPKSPPGRPIVLAGAPEDTHTLPLHILAAALRERRLPSLMLGGRVPTVAVAAAARRTGAAGIFLWRQMSTEERPQVVTAQLREQAKQRARLVLGGPGWSNVPEIVGIHRPTGLSEAVDAFAGVGA